MRRSGKEEAGMEKDGERWKASETKTEGRRGTN